MADQRTKSETLKLARRLRKDMTDAEKRIWYLLRRHQLQGKNFRRQVPIGSYVADFACLSARLIVELDGGQHTERAAQDDKRSAWLKAQGYRVLRFWNNDVLKNTEAVIEQIVAALGSDDRPSP